ncbi:phosphate/phosphite/phosphonate ABC transporter substrate-binding protein [Thalassobaculum sp. OXR-137]|uniref:phosphate/phosphite/phosphonate ABC transporter substrate-binding protein n=1 Tax=Thalassobaculum sp. OXR-137 TaxID=3100173 RepID=UPI002AC9E50D|nr:phosphate/phosphite/phosphonate ABC transporter substrate-binding protein [Thalassobaculum sp. OXR-137]WPZ35934.1 phosphate/phosphite/phosphonate ABC transporter substrate-binding protein [Thalassobaculum sp. OXR-137]
MQPYSPRLATVLVCLFVLASIPGLRAQTDARAPATQPYSFGVVPQQSATRLARDWLPFLEVLSARSGIALRFATVTDIPTFEGCLSEGAFDFAYMNPYHYTVFAGTQGYRAFAHQREHRLRGLVVVRADSEIQNLTQLEGREVAFPSPAAFGASAIQRAELRQLGIAITPVYVKSHDSVYRTVQSGLYPAGGGVIRTLEAAAPEIRDDLRILHLTRAYTPHAFAVHPRIPAGAVEAVAKAMVALAADDPVLAPLGMEGFTAAVDADWDDVRAIALTPEETGIRLTSEGPCPSG